MTRRTSPSVASTPASAQVGTPARRREHRPTHGVVSAKDPARMAPAQRLREIGAILAAGFRRQLEIRSNCLDDRDQVERACELGAVNALENATEETA